MDLTPPRTLNKELLPQPLGPHTNTLAPDITFNVKDSNRNVGMRHGNLRSIMKVLPVCKEAHMPWFSKGLTYVQTIWVHLGGWGRAYIYIYIYIWYDERSGLTSNDRSWMRISPLGVARGVWSNLKRKSRWVMALGLGFVLVRTAGFGLVLLDDVVCVDDPPTPRNQGQFLQPGHGC